MAGRFIQNDFDIINNYILNGIDVRHIYPQIGEHLNTLIADKEPEVRSFSICALITTTNLQILFPSLPQ